MILYTTTIIDATSTYICRYGSNFLRCVLSVRMCACMYISGWVSTCMILRLWPSICVDLFATVFFSCRHHISLLINGISIIMMAKWKLRTISISHIQETMHTYTQTHRLPKTLMNIFQESDIYLYSHFFSLPLPLSLIINTSFSLLLHRLRSTLMFMGFALFLHSNTHLFYYGILSVRKTFDMDQEFVMFPKLYIYNSFFLGAFWPWSWSCAHRTNIQHQIQLWVYGVYRENGFFLCTICASLIAVFRFNVQYRDTIHRFAVSNRQVLFMVGVHFVLYARCACCIYDCGFRMLSSQFTGTIIIF